MIRSASLGALLLVLSLGSCGDDGSARSGADAGAGSTSAETGAAGIDGCVTSKDGELFTATDQMEVSGVVMGDGPVGVVVSYEDGGTVCDWLGLARALVEDGHRVLLYVRGNYAEPERDIVAMAKRLRSSGAERVVLLGGSMGGRLSPLAAERLGDPVAGVVNLSGVVTTQHAAALTVPFLQFVGSGDLLAPVAKMRAADRAADRSSAHELVVVDDDAHASALLDGPHGEQITRRIREFVDAAGSR